MKNVKTEAIPKVAPDDKKEQVGAHQQQILFAENELANSQFDTQSKAAEDGKQILFNNQAYLPIDESNELPIALEAATLSEGKNVTGIA